MKIHNIFIFTALTRMWFLVASQENLIYNFSLASLIISEICKRSRGKEREIFFVVRNISLLELPSKDTFAVKCSVKKQNKFFWRKTMNM